MSIYINQMQTILVLQTLDPKLRRAGMDVKQIPNNYHCYKIVTEERLGGYPDLHV